jgi:hypothetical protein
MIKAFRSSWWVHLPGLLAIALMLALMASRRPWPSRVPVHFDSNFQPNRWGPPWQDAIFPVIATGILLSGIWASAMWSSQEKGRKRFNLILPLVTAPLGAIAGIHFWFWSNLPTLARTGYAPRGWWWVGICALIVCATSILLEILRKPFPDEDESDPPAKSEAEIEAEREIQHQLPRDGRWTYLSSERAGWMRWIIAAMGVLMIASGIWLLQLRLPRFSGILMIGSGSLLLGLIVAFGSLNIQVNARQLVLRGGIMRIRLLRLALSDIVETRVETLRPLANFGGWGIRRRGNTWAYIFRGNRGVRLQTRAGSEYVIGCNEPEKLAAAIRAGTGESIAH